MKDPWGCLRSPQVTESYSLEEWNGGSTRSSLIRRLKNWEDSRAWGEFWSLYSGPVRRIARSKGLPDQDASEVSQAVFLRVARSVRTLERRPRKGAFRRWLVNVIGWCTADHWRRSYRLQSKLDRLRLEVEAEELLSRQTAAPVSLTEQDQDEWRRELLGIAFRRLQDRFLPSTLQIFDLHVLSGMDPQKVAGFLGVSRGAVYLAKLRVLPHLKRELQRLAERREDLKVNQG